ncbi:hypothetical protein FRB94_011256 [Tulasnella sp. JGI-2019a]|nr:hypothetical protein FRB94_011256 [Tulasnella sp. JGI-2019a]
MSYTVDPLGIEWAISQSWTDEHLHKKLQEPNQGFGQITAHSIHDRVYVDEAKTGYSRHCQTPFNPTCKEEKDSDEEGSEEEDSDDDSEEEEEEDEEGEDPDGYSDEEEPIDIGDGSGGDEDDDNEDEDGEDGEDDEDEDEDEDEDGPAKCVFCKKYPQTDDSYFCGNMCAEFAARSALAGSDEEPNEEEEEEEEEEAVGLEEKVESNEVSADEYDEEETTKCILCGTYPQADESYFCGSTCAESATMAAPIILRMHEGDPAFGDISGQFYDTWDHEDKAKPTVQRIYKVIQTEELDERYESYRDQVELDGRFSRRGMASGNERMQWHGTRRVCDVGDDPRRIRLCYSTDCGVCGIIRHSFKLNRVGTAHRPNERPGTEGRAFERFGRGIYTSETSSKSHDYSENHETSYSPYKTMLLTRVVVGRSYRTKDDNESLVRPPFGYHSVSGLVGRNLNHPETVVYEEDAARPAWLIVYE